MNTGTKYEAKYLEQKKKKREENKRKVSRGMGGGEMESRFERSGCKR